MNNLKLIAASLALAVAALTGTTGTSQGANVRVAAIVVSNNLPVDSISFGDLRRLYRGSGLVAGGQQLVPLTYKKDSPERQDFDEIVLGMSGDEVARYWIDRRIRGQSGPPKAVDSPDLLLQVVSKFNGAIGFVWSDDVPPGVKILRIDGKRPGESGYPIRQ